MSTFTGDSRLTTELMYPNRKPVGEVKIDWNHKLAKDLALCYFSTSEGFIDLVSGTKAAPDGSNKGLNLEGLFRDYDTTNASNFKPNDFGAGFSIFAKLNIKSLTSYSFIAGCQDTTTTNGWELRLGTTTTDSNLHLHQANVNYKAWKGDVNLPLSGLSHTIAITSSGVVDTIPTGMVDRTIINFIDGGGNGGTGLINYGSNETYLGSRYDGVTALDGGIYLYCMWGNGRRLSYTEMRSMRLHPYQFLVPDIGA